MGRVGEYVGLNRGWSHRISGCATFREARHGSSRAARKVQLYGAMPPTGRFVARGPPTGYKNKFISAKGACTAAMFMAMMFMATMVQIKERRDTPDHRNAKVISIPERQGRILKFIAGLVLGIILVPVLVYFYFASGSAPVATTDSDMPFEAVLARKAQHVRISKDMPKNVPIQPSEGNYLAAAELYKQHCAVCHGLPMAPKTAIATGMYPAPPLLLEGKGVTDDPPGESYWKIFNGLRLTGMAGFSKSLSETQMWQLALLLANADKLPPSAKTALVAPIASPATSVPATSLPPATSAPVFPSSVPSSVPPPK